MGTLRDSSKLLLPVLLAVVTGVASVGLVGVPWAVDHIGKGSGERGAGPVGPAGSSPVAASTTPRASDGSSPPVYEPGAVVATVPVGASPRGASYDSGNGDVYVANWLSSNVSVISGTSNKVVVTVGVGSHPWGVAYDSGNGEVYVANVDSNNVSVISGTSNKVVVTVGVGSGPCSVAYDSGNGDVYVADYGSNNVSVISGTTNAVVATVSVGPYTNPFAVAYDSGNGEVYVANVDSNNVSVISGTNNTVVATVPVGTFPRGAGYDSGNGDIYVANLNSDNVSVISGTTNAVVATVLVGGGPDAVAYDSGNGEVYVADGGSNSASVISTELEMGSILGPASVQDANPAFLIVPLVFSNPGISSTAVTVSPSGMTCTTPVASLTSVNTTCTGSVAGSFSINVSATDILGASVWSTTGVVDVGPSVTAPAPSRNSADVGQVVVFSTAATNGSGVYLEYAWHFPSALGCVIPPSNSLILICVPNGPVTSGAVTVNVTDSNHWTSATASATYTVSPDPTIAPPAASPPSLDVGQTTVLSATAVNGTRLASTYYWQGLPAGCPSANALTLTCTPSAPGTYEVTAEIIDSNGMTATSGALALSVYPTLGIPSVKASESSVQEGQSITFSVTETGGSSPYTYRWSGLPSGCATANASDLTCKFTATGTYTIGVTVTDMVGATRNATASPVTVSAVSASSGSPSGWTGLDWAIVGVIIVVVAVIGAIVVVRKRRGKGRTATTSTLSGAHGPAETNSEGTPAQENRKSG